MLLFASNVFAQTPPTAPTPPSINAAALYQQHCASCHGEQRTGLMGPALLPESLERTRAPEVLRVIKEGRQATQMMGFGDLLSGAEIQALADWIRTPVVPAPRWTAADITASRIATPLPAGTPNTPLWQADPMNLFVVVEGGDHHISLLDGDKFEVIERFPSRFALHGGPKSTQDGRYVFFGSRDGWITKYDLYRLQVVAEVRAGLNMRNVAVSADGQWVMAANYLPAHPGAVRCRSESGENLRRGHAGRHNQLARLGGVRRDTAQQLCGGPERHPGNLGNLVRQKRRTHLRRPGARLQNERRHQQAGLFERAPHPPDRAAGRLLLDQSYQHALGATRPRKGDGKPSAQVVNLNARVKVADLPIAGMPHLGSGITFAYKDTTVLASPNLGGGGD